MLGPADAAARVRVRLPDGTEGTLWYAPQIEAKGTVGVVIAAGRHYRVPVADLVRLDALHSDQATEHGGNHG